MTMRHCKPYVNIKNIPNLFGYPECDGGKMNRLITSNFK